MSAKNTQSFFDLMKRIIFSLCALMLCAIPSVFGQRFEDNSIKRWTDGPLTLDDFDRRNTGDKDGTMSFLKWKVDFDKKTSKQGNLHFQTFNTYSCMDRLLSWYVPQQSSDWILRYNQASFDRVEVIRRKMQNDLNANPADYYSIFGYYDRLFESELDKFSQESKVGTDTAVIAKMEAQNREELANYKEEPVGVPQYTRPEWGLGGWIGYEGDCFGKPVSEGLTMSNGFNFGFILESRRLVFELSMTMGGCGKMRADNFYYDEKKDYTWEKGKTCTSGIMQLAAGARIINKPYYALRPMVGIGVGFIDQFFDNGSSETSGLRLAAGLVFDYKHKRVYTSYPMPSYREHCISFRLFGSRTTFDKVGETFSINFGVGFSVTEWLDFDDL